MIWRFLLRQIVFFREDKRSLEIDPHLTQRSSIQHSTASTFLHMFVITTCSSIHHLCAGSQRPSFLRLYIALLALSMSMKTYERTGAPLCPIVWVYAYAYFTRSRNSELQQKGARADSVVDIYSNQTHTYIHNYTYNMCFNIIIIANFICQSIRV